MLFSGMLGRVAPVRTDDLEEHIASIIRVTRIGELGTALAVSGCVFQLLATANVLSLPILVTLMMEVIHSSETPVLTRAIWQNTSEDCILHSHRSVNLKSYIALTSWALWQRSNVFPVWYELDFFYPRRWHSSLSLP
jgi:hypothetical protein